jgi:catechol 2,3-dioxygenase
MNPEPIYDLAHLGHLELLTAKPDESLKFFVDVMGMTISGRNGESVYLRILYPQRPCFTQPLPKSWIG